MWKKWKLLCMYFECKNMKFLYWCGVKILKCAVYLNIFEYKKEMNLDIFVKKVTYNNKIEQWTVSDYGHMFQQVYNWGKEEITYNISNIIRILDLLIFLTCNQLWGGGGGRNNLLLYLAVWNLAIQESCLCLQ